MNIVIIAFIASLGALSASSEAGNLLYYVSEERGLLEKSIDVSVNGEEHHFSGRPYGGLVVQKISTVPYNNAISVQIDGELLEKDWPSVPLAIKLPKRWVFSIEKDQLDKERGARILIHGLTKEESELLIKEMMPTRQSKK